jgi:hypothetical protein
MKNEVPSGDLQITKHEIPSGDLLKSTWNPIWRFLLFFQQVIRGPIWRPPNSETRDPFWQSPLVNLESHLAIPFIQQVIRGPIWRPSNSEVWDPFWRSPSTWNPIWRFLLFKAICEVPSGDLLWPISKYKIPSGYLRQLGIPSGDSLLFEAEIMRSLLAISKTKKSIL